MSNLRITLNFDIEGGTTYGDLRRFVQLTSTLPDHYPLTFDTDPDSEDERIVSMSESGKQYSKEDQWPATTPE